MAKGENSHSTLYYNTKLKYDFILKYLKENPKTPLEKLAAKIALNFGVTRDKAKSYISILCDAEEIIYEKKGEEILWSLKE